jgi:hypothetical protein
MKRHNIALVPVLCFLIAGGAHAQSYSFSAIPDGLQPTQIRRPYAINDAGTILLQPYSAYNTSTNCLLITGSTVKATEQYPGTDQYYSLSNNGYITGTGIVPVYYLDSQYNQTAIAMPAGDTGYPTGINTSLTVVGMATSPVNGFYAWTSKNGTFAKYVYPGSTGCTLNGINDIGDMVGTYFVDNSHKAFFGFVVTKGKGKEIAVPACIDPTPSAISGNGIVVGTAISIPSNRRVGFVRSKGGSVAVIDYKKYAPASIEGPSGPAKLSKLYGTEVFGVNSSGVIVGTFTGTYVSADGQWSQTNTYPFMGKPK